MKRYLQILVVAFMSIASLAISTQSSNGLKTIAVEQDLAEGYLLQFTFNLFREVMEQVENFNENQ